MSDATEPVCFGKEWDGAAAECAGGYDANYVSPSGSQIREKCAYLESCRVRTHLQRSSPNLVPPSALNRTVPGTQPWRAPPVAPAPYKPPPAVGPQAPPVWQQPPQGVTQQQQAQWAQFMAWMQHQQQGGPQNYPVPAQMSPIQMQATSYAMPSYLSTTEARDGSWWGALGREVVRGMGKSFGHTLAHYFDTVPFR